MSRLGGRLRTLALVVVALLPFGSAQAQQAGREAPQKILVLLRLAPQHYRPGSSYSGDYGRDQLRGARQRLASRVARDHGLTLVDEWPMPMLGLDCFIMATAPGQTAAAAAADSGVGSTSGVRRSPLRARREYRLRRDCRRA